MGVVAIADPVRADVPQAVKECIDAGIQIKIVTGDTPGTAKEIGRQIGLWNRLQILTATSLPVLNLLHFPIRNCAQRIEGLKIISRARPMDKKRLVETLQKHEPCGLRVTGDGTNDAPASEGSPRGTFNGRRYVGGQGGFRHYHHRQLVLLSIGRR